MKLKSNYYVQDQINYTTSAKTRPGWKRRYDFALQHIKNQDTVLDCACGIGEGTYIISQACEKATGVDIDNHFIDYCRKKWPGIEFICTDASKGLPFDDEFFNAVVSIETIEHLVSHDMVQAVLKDFHRVLKKGGLLITSVPNAAHAALPTFPQRMKLLVLKLFGTIVKKQARWHEHYQFWDAAGFSSLLSTHFADVSVYGERAEGITQDTGNTPYLVARATK